MERTAQLQKDIAKNIKDMNFLFEESLDLYNFYWKSNVNTLISALLLGSTPATLSTNLTKSNCTDGLTFCEKLVAFFDNASLGSAADYMTTLQTIQIGNASGVLVANNVEAWGARLVNLIRKSIKVYKAGVAIENTYNSLELSSVVSAMSTQTVVYGSDMTKDQLTSAITLFQNYDTFLNNGAPGTADRKVTLGKWYNL